jgi:hypothetical protein
MIFNQLNIFFDLITAPFAALSPVACIALLSLASALVLLSIFKKLSNQDKIKFHKNKIFGFFLEIAIYRDQFSRTMSGQFNVLRHNLLYMRYFLTPILVMTIPMSLICLQLDYRLGTRPMQVGESFIIQASLDPALAAKEEVNQINIKTSDNISLESPAVRIPSAASVYWRAKMNNPVQDSFVSLSIDNREELTKAIVIPESKAGRFSSQRRKINSLSDLLYSAGPPIPASSQFLTIRTDYQAATYPFLFWNISPIVYFFILTLGFGLLLKPILKVNI